MINFLLIQGGTTRRRMTIRRKDPSSSTLPQKLSPEQVRAKIIEEIISTERDYVKHLEDIIEVRTTRPLIIDISVDFRGI